MYVLEVKPLKIGYIVLEAIWQLLPYIYSYICTIHIFGFVLKVSLIYYKGLRMNNSYLFVNAIYGLNMITNGVLCCVLEQDTLILFNPGRPVPI